MTALPAPITVFAPVMPGQTTAYGLRSVSRVHRDKPYVFVAGHEEHRGVYVPGEGTSYLFAATPTGAADLVLDQLPHHRSTPNVITMSMAISLKVECPVSSGKMLTLQETAQELSRRTSHIFMPVENGERPCHRAITLSL